MIAGIEEASRALSNLLDEWKFSETNIRFIAARCALAAIRMEQGFYQDAEWLLCGLLESEIFRCAHENSTSELFRDTKLHIQSLQSRLDNVLSPDRVDSVLFDKNPSV